MNLIEKYRELSEEDKLNFVVEHQKNLSKVTREINELVEFSFYDRLKRNRSFALEQISKAFHSNEYEKVKEYAWAYRENGQTPQEFLLIYKLAERLG